MRKVNELTNIKQIIENEDDPFKVVYYYRVIYKCKRRKALRSLKLAEMSKAERDKILKKTMA